MKTSRLWMPVGLLWLAYLLNYVDRQVVFSIFPALQSELGFSSVQLGLIGSVFIWVYALCSPLCGRLADVIRRERLVLASLVLWSLATLATGFSGSVAALLFWRGAMGVTEALYFPAALAVIGAIHSGQTRSRAISIHGSAQLAGIAVGGWYGGWMAGAWGWRAAFAVLAIAGVAYAPVLWLGLRRVPAIAAPHQKSEASPRQIFASRCFQALALAFFMFCAMLWMLYAWLPNWIYERYHLSLAESGFTATVYLQASSAIGILSGGAIADWCVRRVAAARFYLVGLGLLLSSPFAYFTWIMHSLALLKLASAAFGIFAGLMMSNVVASAYEVTSERNYGLAAGALNMVGGLAGGLGIFFAGKCKDSIGIEPLMGWGAIASGAAALLLIAVTASRFRKEAGG